ncbi:alpha/beta hydrolase family protein [Bacteroides sp.]|uniref:alpha/beta hydrolase n=1 Tax=Bacteroides sp. TaxID=29523 RepID=UPI001B415AC4|nr:alpha/beta hydrolase family protein [Bacteroides sp.]MBP6066242.1 esterase family protein [Bacteroides sp.]MBP6066901.1 esterase family protein [Bacteroides sp.]MBP6936638.1 esterase family protein [Bacteroides sp.]MBP8621980.1 esterase family protein [Bacteroides sp.]MBP9507000.1 esterase family protein [Bacteroides sp.]
MKRKSTIILCLLLLATPFYAARVDTLLVKSSSMNKEIKVVVIAPDAALGKKPVASPVVYLLHGYSGNAKTWINVKPELPQIADEKGLIFVCPDGKNSWYWDSPMDAGYRYETFVSKELIAYIDTHYATIADRKARAITGLSMGGHGALWNAIRNKAVFGAAGSTSGGVDIRPFPQNWEMAKQLGEFAANKKRWDEHTVINLANTIENGDLALIIDCGEADFFLEVNKSLHQRLLARKIDHDFILRPGAHNGAYWNNSIDYQILFFDKFFKKK